MQRYINPQQPKNFPKLIEILTFPKIIIYNILYITLYIVIYCIL